MAVPSDTTVGSNLLSGKMWKMSCPILVNATMSFCAYKLTVKLIPKVKDMFIKANLFGIDMSKRTSDKV